jgi:hypothetical protein
MLCVRCGGEIDQQPVVGGGLNPLEHRSKDWCRSCNIAYDAWSRQHASDILVVTLSGAMVMLGLAIGLPLLGASVLVAAGGAVCAFGTIVGVGALNQRRRRRQFLAAGPLPRAYLPDKT